MKKLLVIFLLFLFPFTVFARFEEVISSVDNFFSEIKGIVISVDGNKVYTDLKADNGLYIGKKLNIVREGEAIIHPITGKVLGKKIDLIATAKVIEIEKGYSVLQVLEAKKTIKVKDLVKNIGKTKVSWEFKNLIPRHKILFKEAIKRSFNTVPISDSNIVIKVSSDKLGGILLNIFVDGQKIKEMYFADINKENTSGADKTVDMFKSKIIDKEYTSIVIGNIFGDRDSILVADDDSNIDIYDFDGNDFKLVKTIKTGLSHILNIEAIDLNKNGIDEIYVTNLFRDKMIKSRIYEFKNNKEIILKDEIPYVFRLILENGTKKLVVQRLFRDGSPRGLIHYYIYNNGYMTSDVIPYTKGISVYGFGFGKFTNKTENNILFIDNSFNLNIKQKDKVIFKSLNKFNKTPNYFVIEEYKKMAEMPLDQNADFDEMIQYKKYLKGRLFIDSNNTLYVMSNLSATENLALLDLNYKSYVSSYKWLNSGINRLWTSGDFEPVIVDFYMQENLNKIYIIVLRKIGGGFIFGAKSQFIYIEIK